MPDTQEFHTFLEERMREKSMSVPKLSETTDIAMKHLQNLLHGRYEDLPPAPYLHGYLTRIGEALGFDGEAWWEEMRTRELLKGSGADDELPKNRFAERPMFKMVTLGAVVLIIVILIVLRFSFLAGTPELTVTSPEEALSTVTTETVVLRGEATRVNRLLINDELVPVGEDGAWEKSFMLQPGLNSIRIIAKKFLGREKEVIRQVVYEPPFEEATSTPPIESDTE